MVWCLMKQRDSTILIYFCTPYFTFLFFTSSVLVKITVKFYFVLLPPAMAQIPSSVSYSQTASVYVPS
jgi:hypothetical protein